MPPPIVPAPITPTLRIGARLGVFGQALDLVRLALGEEEIALRRATASPLISSMNSLRSSMTPSAVGLLASRP